MKYKKYVYYFIIILIFFNGLELFSAETVDNNNIINPIDGIIFKIITEPSGAEIYINNLYVGSTPLNKLRGKKGKYNIKVVKSGYKEFDTVINLDKMEQEFSFNLEKLPWEPLSNNLSLKYFLPFISKIDKEEKMAFFFAYRYHFPLNHSLSNISVETIAGLINMKLKYAVDEVPDSGETSLTIVPLSLNLHYNFFRRFKYISPYIGFGFGVCIINMQVEKYEKTSMIFSLIGGINFFTNWPVSFQIEVLYTWLGEANIPIKAIGSSGNITLREKYFFKGFFVSFSIVGRF